MSKSHPILTGEEQPQPPRHIPASLPALSIPGVSSKIQLAQTAWECSQCPGPGSDATDTEVTPATACKPRGVAQGHPNAAVPPLDLTRVGWDNALKSTQGQRRNEAQPHVPGWVLTLWVLLGTILGTL